MGRPQVERRELTTEEHEQATSLMEKYAGLAKRVAGRYYRQHELGNQSWGGFSHEDILGAAYEGLCEAALDYVEQGKCPKALEKSYQAKEIELSEKRERAYLAQAIENKIIDFVRHENSVYTLKEQAEQDGVPTETKTRRFISLEAYKKREEANAEFLHEETQGRTLTVNALEVFAKTLPAEEQALLEETQRDAKAKQRRTPDEFAKALGISRSLFFERRRSIKEKLHWWLKGRNAATEKALQASASDVKATSPQKRLAFTGDVTAICGHTFRRKGTLPDTSPPRLTRKGDIAAVMEKGAGPDDGGEPSDGFTRLDFGPRRKSA